MPVLEAAWKKSIQILCCSNNYDPLFTECADFINIAIIHGDRLELYFKGREFILQIFTSTRLERR